MENLGVSGTDTSAAASTDPPAFGITIVNRPARVTRRTLKAIVFNARTGARFAGIVACLRRPPLADADVIMLCETDWRLRRSFNREIALDLAQALREPRDQIEGIIRRIARHGH